MNTLSNITAVVTLVALALVACDQPEGPDLDPPDAPVSDKESPDHPAADAAERFLRAIQYKDTRTAARSHVESTHEGFYCQSEEFRRVFAAARERRGPEACADVKALSNRALAQLDDGARLAAQMLRVICEQPDASCADYSRRVLEAQRDSWASWTQTLQRFEIKRALGDDREAVVYVDLFDRPRGEPDHRTLRMNKIDGQWYVADALLGSAQTTSPARPETSTDSSPEADYN